MKYTTLYQTHHKLRATFDERHEGWQLPIKYTDPISEHNAVRSNAGIADISYLGILKLTGEDRAKFLHRLISNDVEGLAVGEGNYATLLTNRGKIIADLRIYILENDIIINTAPETIETVYAELDKYIIADDVELSIETEKVGSIAVYGPKSVELVQNVLDTDQLNSLPTYHSKKCEVDNQWVVCARSDIVGEYGFHLFTTTNALDGLWRKLITAKPNVAPIGWNALETLRIEAGIPRFGTELNDSIFPLEAELEHAIDFEKGCYIGQEIVARMKYRGHPNRLLRGIVLDSENTIQENSRIFNGDKDVGWVTSSTFSPSLGKQIALGYVRIIVSENATMIKIETYGKHVSGTVVTLPFILDNL